jgi:hypothetical protein
MMDIPVRQYGVTTVSGRQAVLMLLEFGGGNYAGCESISSGNGETVSRRHFYQIGPFCRVRATAGTPVSGAIVMPPSQQVFTIRVC